MISLKELSVRQKIIIFSIISSFVGFFILLFFLQPSNPYGKEVAINNYSEYLSALPSDRRDAINNHLYNIVGLNLGSDDINIGDAVIRNDSVIELYDKEDDMNHGRFIVDIESIKQSYLIQYSWSKNENNPNITKYNSAIKCLPISDLIYGDFSCKDNFSDPLSSDNRDPIMEFLPYDTFNIHVTAISDKKGSVELNADIFLSLADTRNNLKDESIKKYKSQVVKWIKSTGLNPGDYPIYYTIND